MPTSTTRPAFRLSVLSLLLLAAAPAFADDTAADKEKNAAQTELKTVNVSGQNRSTRTENRDSYTTSAMRTTTGLALSPKETPQSVSVITKTQLEDQNISTMEDALKTTTGVNVVKDSGRYRYLSRGFYINQIEEDGLATTVAGGASGNPYRDSQSMTDLAVYDHIEVVRGATGLTQSNNEPGGTINAVRKKPTAQTQRSVSLSADRFGTVRGVGDLSGRLNEAKTLRGRMVGVLERDNSFKDNVDGKKGMLYGVLEADAGENTKLTAGVMYQRNEYTPDNFGVPMGVNGGESGLSRDTYLGYDWNNAVYKKFNVFAEAEHYFNDDWKLTAKINHYNNDSDNRFGAIYNSSTSYTGLTANGTLSTQNLQRYVNKGKQTALQLNLNGKYYLLGRSHDLFLGYTYSHEKNDTTWQRIRNSSAYSPFTFTGTEIASPDWSQYNDQVFYKSSISSNAFMMGTRFNPTDKLHIIAGTRYTRWRASSLTDYNWWNSKADSDTDEYVANSKNRFIPYFGITYDITPQQSVYASYTSIFKPQTNLDYYGKMLDPLMGINYEIGWKGEWFNRTLNTSVALFHVTQKNRPIYVTDQSHKNGGYYTSLGEVRSQGFDVEASGNLTENWKVFAGYTFNNSKYRQTESSRYTAASNFSVFTPRHMFRLYTSYRLPGKANKWTIGGGMTVQSETTSIYSVHQGGYTLFNANVQYEPTKNLQLALVGSNLTDKRYYENNRVRTLGMNNFYGTPRNVAFKLNWKF
ncbi:TonB-dependent siderophore receptor [Neisseria perflava]|uniref:TonB-dependent siderophore receptor n=1 Tax=Neisseria perflava TaxID=33053 RepID=UPI0020A0269F|nr:TonB-dependent siderophore receptor [Neisseria perflava]MCP1659620.1 outer membrane receptor for ferric coprogen and ferric-rhodotorulic acid [Neisseria perflava]